MVHTSEFVYIIREENKEKIKKYFELKPKDLAFKSELYNGINIILKENYFRKFIYLKINFIQLLNKFNISDDDLEEILNKLNDFSQTEFGLYIDDFSMTRIDYRYDYKMPNIKNREAYIKLLQKNSFNKYKYKIKKIDGSSSIKFTNNSSQLLIYDKEVEKLAKNLTVANQERDVIRFEYVLFNNHLRYKKFEGEDKKLTNYLKEEKFFYYFDKEVLGILRKGDYLKIYKARRIIRNSSLKNNVKEKLIDFLIDISRSTIDSVKKSTKYSNHYYYKYLKLLEQLNINPLMIPKNCGANSTIINPLKNYKSNIKTSNS